MKRLAHRLQAFGTFTLGFAAAAVLTALAFAPTSRAASLTECTGCTAAALEENGLNLPSVNIAYTGCEEGEISASGSVEATSGACNSVGCVAETDCSIEVNLRVQTTCDTLEQLGTVCVPPTPSASGCAGDPWCCTDFGETGGFGELTANFTWNLTAICGGYYDNILSIYDSENGTYIAEIPVSVTCSGCTNQPL